MPAVAAVVAVVSSVGAGAAAVVGVVGVSGMTAAVVGGAVIGVVAGGVIAAVKGENILKGALKGGLIGGALGGIGAWAAPVAAEAGVASQAAGLGIVDTASVGAQMGMGAGPTGLGVTATGGLVPAEVAGTELAAPLVTKTVIPPVTKGVIGTMTTGEKMLAAGSLLSGVSEAMGPSEEDIIAAQSKREAEEYERSRRKIQPGVQIPQDQMRIAGAGPVSIERPGWVDEISAQPLPAVRPTGPLAEGTVAPQHYTRARGLLEGGANA